MLAEGLYFGEGPRWHDDRLCFSDFYDHAVKTVDLDGNVEIGARGRRASRRGSAGCPTAGCSWCRCSTASSCGVEPDGSLVGPRRPVRHRHLPLQRHGRRRPRAGPTSATSASTSTPTCTSTASRALLAEPGPPKAKLARVDPDGTVSVAAEDLKFPNGTVITPDGRTMILAETLGLRLTAFDIDSDGSLHNRRVWADLGARPPDGICLDADTNVWVADPLEPVCFLVAEGGGIVDEVDTDAAVLRLHARRAAPPAPVHPHRPHSDAAVASRRAHRQRPRRRGADAGAGWP